ncbi:MAG: rod shape-determining protein MreD [Gammaproteobacteria bacterium]|nr:rod shape-determining protein MreD [Gammaproteobacteria bacterium]
MPRLQHFGLIPLTIIAALMLAIIPLPDWGRYARPDWVGLVIIFWSIVLPQVFSIGSAWITGLLLDVILGAPLGQNALGFVIVVYITSRMHQQFLTAPLLQQAFFVAILLLIKQFLSLWINGMTGHLADNLYLYFAPSLVAMLLWPWLFIVMRDLGRGRRLI